MNQVPFIDISGVGQGAYPLTNYNDKMLMMKSSGGDAGLYLDSQLVNNYANAKKKGIIPFMYHVAGAFTPYEEATFYLQAVSPLTQGDGYALDLEPTCNWTPAEVLIFVQQVHNKTNCYPWVYMDRSRYASADWSAVYALCGKWIAAPDIPFSATIPGVGVYIAQQGPVVNGVDTDMFFGTLEELIAYTYLNTVTTPKIISTPKQAISEPKTPETSTTSTPTQTAVKSPEISSPATVEKSVSKTQTNMPSVQDKASSLKTKDPHVNLHTLNSQRPSLIVPEVAQAPQKSLKSNRSWWINLLTSIWNFIKNF